MTESIQTRLKRVRAPRVRITYDADIVGGKAEEELPFIVGILSDLRGDLPEDDAVPLAQRPIHDIDRNSIDKVMRSIGPGVAIDLSLPELDGLGEADAFLRFHSMGDFAPLSVVQALPTLCKAYSQRNELCLLKDQNQGNAAIDQRVAQIDALLSLQVSAILRQDAFRRLEASWRGLHYLVSRTETSPLLRLKVLDVAKSELCKDMDGVAESGRGILARMLRDAAAGVDGGFPYGLLVGDYEFGAGGADLALVGKIAEVAASTNTSFIAAASCRGFGLDSVDPLAPPRDLESVFQAHGLTSWREWRAQDVSRYVTLALPRVLLRLPHDGSERTDFLWGNAAWVLAERVTHAFALYGWPAAIRGVEGGGLVENFPLCGAAPDTGAAHPLCPTEVVISDRYDKELAALGLMPLYHLEGTASAVFVGGQADHAPNPRFFSDVRAIAGLSTTLPYVLAASRFAHYFNVIMRKNAGMTRAGVESRLNDWLAHYVLLDDNAPQDVKATFPLRAANVVVTEASGEPDRHTAIVFIKPHFQFEELPTSIRLVVPLPA